jgi:hypothetical protein
MVVVAVSSACEASDKVSEVTPAHTLTVVADEVIAPAVATTAAVMEDSRAERMAASALEALVVPSSRASGRPYHWASCRSAPMGCDARVRAISRAVVREADAAGVRAELLGAMAWVESRWSPLASGRLGEVGILQVLPRTARAHGLRIDDPARAGRCHAAEDGCAGEVLRVGARLLRRAIDACDGSERRGLCGYNTGRCAYSCQYSTAVLATETRMR